MTLKLGLSYHGLAVSGLDALEEWSERIPCEQMKHLLNDVLPCLDGYLQVSTDRSG